MAKCIRCGRVFVYNDEVGYYHDICSSMCDGALSQQPKIEKLTADLAECRRLLREAVEVSRCDDEWFGNQIEDEWFEAARKAAGGE